MTDLDIPEFLRIPQSVRREAWVRNPPKAMPAAVEHNRYGRNIDATQKAYRQSIEDDKALKRAVNEQRWAELRAKAAADKAERAEVVKAVRRRKR